MDPLLLDTQLLLWLAVQPELLPDPLLEELAEQECDLRFSVVSLWEVAIKTSIGRRDFQVDAVALRRGLLRAGFAELPIDANHCLAVQTLPWVHHDPFDRLLVVQAQIEGLTLLSADRVLLGYEAPVRWVERRRQPRTP